jgi:hypothetical protein
MCVSSFFPPSHSFFLFAASKTRGQCRKRLTPIAPACFPLLAKEEEEDHSRLDGRRALVCPCPRPRAAPDALGPATTKSSDSSSSDSSSSSEDSGVAHAALAGVQRLEREKIKKVSGVCSFLLSSSVSLLRLIRRIEDLQAW